MSETTESTQQPVKVSMGECSSCHKEWFMFESEKTWWLQMIEKCGAKWPKRCKSCRDKNRLEQYVVTSCSDDIQDLLNQIKGQGLPEKEDIENKLLDILGVVKVLEQKIRKSSNFKGSRKGIVKRNEQQ